MKKFGWLLPAAAALTLLAGCNKEIQVAKAAFEDAVTAGEGIDARAEASCSMEYLTGGVPQDVMDGINARIVENHILFDEADGSTDVPAAVRTWVEETLASCGFEGEEITEENAWAYHWTFEREGAFTDAREHIIGVVIVASGADDAATVARLAHAAGVALDIDQNCIEVFRMGEEK